MQTSLCAEEIVDRVAQPLVSEFRAALKGLRDSVSAIPDVEWVADVKPGDCLPRHACHLLFSIEAYLDGHRVKMGQRYGVPVESLHKVVERYPSQADVLRHITAIDERIDGWVRKFARKAMTGKRKQHNPLNRVVYVLRHAIVHLAYLRREMYRRGIPRPRY